MNYAYWLSNIPGVGNRLRTRLWEYAGSAGAVYEMSEKELLNVYGIGEKEAGAVTESKREDWQGKYEKLQEKNIRFLSREDAGFPKKLGEIPDAPYSIYIKGNMWNPAKKSVAIVGARMCSPYGQAVARKLGEVLAAHDVQVISGMAKGIDSAGHNGAIAGKGATFAVFGCGVDVCYPASNRPLYEEIQKNGGIYSEYPPGTAPKPGLFPLRNRMISALSDAVVIVEAKARSGSLITADYALEQGKDVYAVPGRMFDSLSKGCNALIRQGAGIVTDIEEFCAELGLSGGDFAHTLEKNHELLLEKDVCLVYSGLDLQPKSLVELMEQTGLGMTELADALTRLQENGLIKETFRNYYIKNI
jgi:DNA processing protein